MKYLKLFIVFTLFVIANSSIAQTKNDVSSENPKHFVNLLGSGAWGGNMFKSRLEMSYNHKLKEKLYLGVKIGYKINGTYLKRLGVGPNVRYVFKREGVESFVEADLMILNTWVQPYSYWSRDGGDYEKYSDFGASAKLWAGFQYRLPNKHLGFEVKIGIGTELFKQYDKLYVVDVTYTSNNYTYQRESYLQLGLIYSF